jgi:hypothetical protein
LLRVGGQVVGFFSQLLLMNFFVVDFGCHDGILVTVAKAGVLYTLSSKLPFYFSLPVFATVQMSRLKDHASFWSFPIS